MKDGSAIKSTGCSYKGPRFSSQHPNGDSQPSVTQAPMGLGSDTFSGLVGHQACIWCTSIHKKTHTHVGKTVIHMKPEMRKIEMCVMFLLQSTDKRPNSISIPYLKFTINKTMPNL